MRAQGARGSGGVARGISARNGFFPAEIEALRMRIFPPPFRTHMRKNRYAKRWTQRENGGAVPCNAQLQRVRVSLF